MDERYSLDETCAFCLLGMFSGLLQIPLECRDVIQRPVWATAMREPVYRLMAFVGHVSSR